MIRVSDGAILAPYKPWGTRAEDPFRGLRAGPVRSSPFFLSHFPENSSQSFASRTDWHSNQGGCSFADFTPATDQAEKTESTQGQ
jgi:hypothetical protein